MPLTKNLKTHQETSLQNRLDLAIYNNNIEVLQEYPRELIAKRQQKLQEYRNKLAILQNIPLIKQRTPEWFELRKNRLTASDLDDAIKENNLSLAKKKAGVIKDNTNYNGIAALKWGVMYEPMATRCYSQMLQNIPISEFGLIPDNALEHFGASPDGINDIGIMIEIKCPYSREIIDGNILEKYYMQIQGQLAVCGLEECDFIECKFIEYDSVYKYIDLYDNTNIMHGIIAQYKNVETGEYTYLYSEPFLKASHALNDINKQMYVMDNSNTNTQLQFLKLTPWRLEKMNIQRIEFDYQLWKETIPKINKFWEKVEECKKLPIEEPVLKKKKYVFIPEDD
jgi:putative phage-type endonuclease